MRLHLSRKQWGLLSGGLIFVLSIVAWAYWPRQYVSIRHVGWDHIPVDYIYHIKMPNLLRQKTALEQFKEKNLEQLTARQALSELDKTGEMFEQVNETIKNLELEIELLNKTYGDIRHGSLDDLLQFDGTIKYSNRLQALNLSSKHIKSEWKEIHLPVVEYENKTSKIVNFVHISGGSFFAFYSVPPHSKKTVIPPLTSPSSTMKLSNLYFQWKFNSTSGMPKPLTQLIERINKITSPYMFWKVWKSGETSIELKDFPDTPMWRGE